MITPFALVYDFAQQCPPLFSRACFLRLTGKNAFAVIRQRGAEFRGLPPT
jgi:hypothetical protein